MSKAKGIVNSAKKVLSTAAEAQRVSGYRNVAKIAAEQGAKASMKAGFQNMAQAFGEGVWRNYGKQIVAGAAVEGLARGATSAAKGDSFWQGARRGVVHGAMHGAMYGAAKSFHGAPGKSGNFVGTTGAVSKQVYTLARNSAAARTASSAMNAYKKPSFGGRGVLPQ